MSENEMRSMAGVPVYPDVKLYGFALGDMRIWEADDWKEASMSWKTGCYIHGGLSGPQEQTFRGPDAQKFLSSLVINNVYNWPIGTSKHLVLCDKDGLVATHGLATRDSEDSFRQFACAPLAFFHAQNSNLNFKASVRQIFIFQIAGPTSLQVLERVTGEDLRDVKFLLVRPVKIAGFDVEIEISRIGMAGNLAYELRGPLEAGPAVYDKVYQAGKDLGMKRLGWRTYMVNHTEGGFPQMEGSFVGSYAADPNIMKAFFGVPTIHTLTGSTAPSDWRARMRTPSENGWGWMAKFDHDFIGRPAVEAEVANPKRTIVTLRWNPEDVVDIFTSLVKPGEEYKTLELPCTPQAPAGSHADHVIKDGKNVGISSAVVYSYYYREFLTLCTIDIDQAHIGNEVIVEWGDYGKRIKDVRAIVSRFPYLDLPRNQDYDLSTVPSGL